MRNGRAPHRFAALAVLGLSLALAFATLAGAHPATDTTPPILTAGDVTVPATSDCSETFCTSVPFSSFALSVSDPDDTPDQITITCNNLNAPTFFWGMTMVRVRRMTPPAIPRRPSCSG